jgi:hypothetical protein
MALALQPSTKTFSPRPPAARRSPCRAENQRARYLHLDAYAEYHVAAEEFRELDDERVLVLHRYSGLGKTSGLEIGQMASKGADLFHVNDGKVTRLVLYWELERALADLGLLSDPPVCHEQQGIASGAC